MIFNMNTLEESVKNHMNDSNNIDTIKESKKINTKECPKCGSKDIVITIQGEPVYTCKECRHVLGVVPFKHESSNKVSNSIFVSVLRETDNSFNNIDAKSNIIDELDKATETLSYIVSKYNKAKDAYANDIKFIEDNMNFENKVKVISFDEPTFVEYMNLDTLTTSTTLYTELINALKMNTHETDEMFPEVDFVNSLRQRVLGKDVEFKNDSEFVEALYNNFRSNEIVNDISISDDPKCDIDEFIKHMQIIDIKLQKDVNDLLDTINVFKNYIQNGESGLENDSEEISRLKMHNIRAILFLYSQLYAARVDAIIEYTKKYIDIYKALCVANREEEN